MANGRKAHEPRALLRGPCRGPTPEDPARAARSHDYGDYPVTIKYFKLLTCAAPYGFT